MAMFHVTMGEESMRLRDTPSPTPSLAPPRFGFGSPPPEKESLPALAPELLRKINEVLRASREEPRATRFARRARCL